MLFYPFAMRFLREALITSGKCRSCLVMELIMASIWLNILSLTRSSMLPGIFFAYHR